MGSYWMGGGWAMYNARTDFEEKRSSFRMLLDCPITYQDLAVGQPQLGQCLNLSIDGMLLTVKQVIPVGARLRVRVEPKLAISPPLSALVEVLRVDHQAASAEYTLAARITAIDPVTARNGSDPQQ